MNVRRRSIVRCSSILSAFMLVALFVVGCAGNDDSGGDRYTIVATVGMIADVAREVAGEHATVESIMREGIDPHLYNPTRGDIIRLDRADVVFYNGLLLEGKMADVLEKLRDSGKPIHAVGEMIREGGYGVVASGQHSDPHLWMDVSAWMVGVRAIAEALAEHDPTHAGDYRANAEAYLGKLAELDSYARQAIESIPENRRVLVTAHDAFGYMGRAYGLEVHGIQGISTESEAGLRHINELISFLVTRQIPAVFVETSVADKNVQALIEGAEAKGHNVRIGGSLFSDAMGPAGTYEGTYIGMIDHNVTTIARALGGTAPPRGMQEKLSARDE